MSPTDPGGHPAKDRPDTGRPDTGRPAHDHPGPVAAIDVGSGSVKLLITGPDGLTDENAVLVHTAIKTRLIDGDPHRISPSSLAAAAEAFDRFVGAINHHRPMAVIVAGTAAAGTVSNLGALEALVDQKFGVPLQVLSGSREAELALIGASAGRQLDGPVSLLDVGAGSTEFATRAEDGTMHALSLPLGARNLTDSYLVSDPPRAEELSSALSVMELHLDDLRRELLAFDAALESGTIIGSGAVVQIAEVEIGVLDRDNSVDGYVLDKAAAEEVFRALATETSADRAHNPGLWPEHVDDVVGALCVLVEFMRQFAVGDLVVSERSLMHGLAAELLAEG